MTAAARISRPRSGGWRRSTSRRCARSGASAAAAGSACARRSSCGCCSPGGCRPRLQGGLDPETRRRLRLRGPGAARGPGARGRRAAAPGVARPNRRGGGRGGWLPLGGAALPEPLGRGHGDRRHALERTAVLRPAAAGPMTRPVRRCAIYTRKSSEEGLEQDFNSLDAQREACAAYVKSQAQRGLAGARDRYDDGGFSGGVDGAPGAAAAARRHRRRQGRCGAWSTRSTG